MMSFWSVEAGSRAGWRTLLANEFREG